MSRPYATSPKHMSRPYTTRKRGREEEKIHKPGKYFDVVSLLSPCGSGDLIRNNGDRLALRRDTFKGKHVLLCCFQVPLIVAYTRKFRQLVTLCTELYSSREKKDDFEMVVVASMKDGVDKEIFDHFLSWFPKSCLAVLFDNWKRHYYICKVLGLGAGGRHSFEYVFVNADGKVSPFPSFEDYIDPLTEYGADAFPFTEDVIKERDEECRRLMFEESNNLEAVLRCNDSSPAYVYKLGGGPQERLHISKLRNKHVGLFLACSGDLINDILEKYEQCRKNKLDFEVVVVYSPGMHERENMWPRRFKKHMDDRLHLLQKNINTCHRWWFLPFNDSVTKRFWRMTRHHCCDYVFCDQKSINHAKECDKLIVVGPGVKHLDMYGAVVMKCEGISGYPFTTEAAIAYKMKKLRELTLESLFAGTGVTRGDDRQLRVVPVGELKASKVFLFFDDVDRDFDFKTILPVYTELKKRFGYEMVIVDVGASIVPDEEHLLEHLMDGVAIITYTCPITGESMPCDLVSDEERREIESKMPWYVCPINESLMEVLRAVHVSSLVLVGFGDDGRVCNEYLSTEEFELQLFKPRKASLYHQVEKFLGYDHLARRMRD